LNIAVGDMLSTNPEREASCALFCKSISTKPLVFESTSSVFSKLFRSCALELFVVALLVLRMFVSVLASDRVVYHKNNGGRFFLIFEAKYPNPELKKGKAGCFAVADFWKEIDINTEVLGIVNSEIVKVTNDLDIESNSQ
jgi:hypothetical protein